VENPDIKNPQEPTPWRLPRRDYLLLPLLCLVTAVCMLGIAEAASRIAFAQHEKDACMIADPVLGTRFKPNYVSHVKSAEGPWVTNRYNSCGFRTPQPCGPLPPGDVRIAVLGSSIAQGYLVPYHDTFAALDGEALSRNCGKSVQFQNLASIGYIWQRLAIRAHDALALKPDAAVIVVVPFDLQQSEPTSGDAVHAVAMRPGPMKRLESVLKSSRAVVAAQHYLFGRPDLYVPLYLHYGDRADFLRPPFTQLWQDRLANFDRLMAGIAREYKAADVPLLLVFVPERAQAAMLADHAAPPGVNPYAFGQAIGRIAARHGIDYLDLSTDFADIPDAASLYYPVDGHLAASGDAVLAHDLIPALVHDVPALSACMQHNVVAAVPR
jgi:hypothetical protein